MTDFATGAAVGRSLSVRLSLCALAFVAIGANPVLAAGPSFGRLPSHITRAGLIQTQVLPAPGAPATGGALQLDLSSGNHSMTVDLVPSDIVSDSSTIRWFEPSGIRTEPAPQIFYQGSVRGEAGSTAAFTVQNGRIDGAVRIGNELHYFEPATRYDVGASTREVVGYRASDVDSTQLPPLGCGAQSGATQGLRLPGELSGSGIGGATGLFGNTPGMLEVALVADTEMYGIHGEDTDEYMLGLLNLVDALYLNDLNLTLMSSNVDVYTSEPDPFSATLPNQLLPEVGSYKNGSSASVQNSGVAHLLTGKSLQGGIVGIAYLHSLQSPALCSNFFGTSLSRNYTQDNHRMTLLMAHEIGHNLGAEHDGESGSPCSGTGFGFVMWPAINVSLAEQFSTCSINTVTPLLQSASCVTEAVPSTCGNGQLDSGEECDDGNTVNGDCCRLNCTWEVAGSPCAEDSNQCTDDVCNGAGSCTHPFNEAPCADGDVCTIDGRCSFGSCQASTTPRPLASRSGQAAVSFRDGPSNDRFTFKGKIIGADFDDTPVNSGFRVRLESSTGAEVYEGEIPPGWFEDRSGKGKSFKFRWNGVSSITGRNGITDVKIKAKQKNAQYIVSGKVAGHEIPAAAGQTVMDLQIQVGGDLIGECGTASNLGCRPRATSNKCR